MTDQQSLTRIALHGATGRMGQEILRVAQTIPGISISTILLHSNSARAKFSAQDVANIKIIEWDFSAESNLLIPADVLVDFSHADVFDSVVSLVLKQRLALLSGTTGLRQQQFDTLESAARQIPVLWSANFSLGMAVLMALTKQAAQLVPDWDCEIIETHHRHKVDAPSGSALNLGKAVAGARTVEFAPEAKYVRAGSVEKRNDGDIAIHSLRGGDIVGEHAVLFAGEGERIELKHTATSRAVFARGALEASAWVKKQVPGLYTMDHLIQHELR